MPKPYIVELQCKPADKNSTLVNCHVTVCAIADSSELAESMAINLTLSHSLIVESDALVYLKSELTDNKELSELLYQNALIRKSHCALQLECNDAALDETQYIPLGVPSVDDTEN